jgi:hypothetical protein
LDLFQAIAWSLAHRLHHDARPPLPLPSRRIEKASSGFSIPQFEQTFFLPCHRTPRWL